MRLQKLNRNIARDHCKLNQWFAQTDCNFSSIITNNSRYKENPYRIDADGVRSLKHSIYCRVQLQYVVFRQCSKPEDDRNW